MWWVGGLGWYKLTYNSRNCSHRRPLIAINSRRRFEGEERAEARVSGPIKFVDRLLSHARAAGRQRSPHTKDARTQKTRRWFSAFRCDFAGEVEDLSSEGMRSLKTSCAQLADQGESESFDCQIGNQRPRPSSDLVMRSSIVGWFTGASSEAGWFQETARSGRVSDWASESFPLSLRWSPLSSPCPTAIRSDQSCRRGRSWEPRRWRVLKDWSRLRRFEESISFWVLQKKYWAWQIAPKLLRQIMVLSGSWWYWDQRLPDRRISENYLHLATFSHPRQPRSPTSRQNRFCANCSHDSTTFLQMEILESLK